MQHLHFLSAPTYHSHTIDCGQEVGASKPDLSPALEVEPLSPVLQVEPLSPVARMSEEELSLSSQGRLDVLAPFNVLLAAVDNANITYDMDIG